MSVPEKSECPVCGRRVDPDPLVLGPVWCNRCIRDEIDRDRQAARNQIAYERQIYGGPTL